MVETFGAASHDEVMQLLMQVAVLLAAARLFGALSQGVGQPSVAGEILAGVVLGPRAAFRLPARPLVTLVLSLTVAKVDGIRQSL